MVSLPQLTLLTGRCRSLPQVVTASNRRDRVTTTVDAVRERTIQSLDRCEPRGSGRGDELVHRDGVSGRALDAGSYRRAAPGMGVGRRGLVREVLGTPGCQRDESRHQVGAGGGENVLVARALAGLAVGL